MHKFNNIIIIYCILFQFKIQKYILSDKSRDYISTIVGVEQMTIKEISRDTFDKYFK